jgi:hypothetical protein
MVGAGRRAEQAISSTRKIGIEDRKGRTLQIHLAQLAQLVLSRVDRNLPDRLLAGRVVEEVVTDVAGAKGATMERRGVSRLSAT